MPRTRATAGRKNGTDSTKAARTNKAIATRYKKNSAKEINSKGGDLSDNDLGFFLSKLKSKEEATGKSAPGNNAAEVRVKKYNRDQLSLMKEFIAAIKKVSCNSLYVHFK